MKKMNPLFWGALAALALALLGVVLYFIGFLDLYIIFFLIPAGIITCIATFIYSLVRVRRLKKAGLPVSMATKAALIVSAVILLTVILSITALIIVFAMAISFM